MHPQMKMSKCETALLLLGALYLCPANRVNKGWTEMRHDECI